MASEVKEEKEIPSTGGNENNLLCNQLREVKNFHNIVDRPGSRASFDFNYQEFSGGKNNNHPPQSSHSVFKKTSQNATKTF